MPFPGALLHMRASPLPGSPQLQPVGGMGHGDSEPLGSSSLSEASPPTPPLTLVSPILTVRSPPGLAKTPLSALGLKPHNPAEILLHPVGGECRHGGCWRFSWGGVCVQL